MRLLVSVTSTFDAEAALAGGADLVDAKDPTAGALGPVSLDQFHRIVGTVAGARPVTAALGDVSHEAVIERSAGAFAAAGAAFVKIGFAGIERADRIASLIAAAVRGTNGGFKTAWCPPSGGPEVRLKPDATGFETAVVAVAYADAEGARTVSLNAIAEIASRAGAAGVLLDTFDKGRGGLRDLIAPAALAAWIAAAHDAGLFVALAGKLTASDLLFVRDAGADIAGVRGAACDGGRAGRVTADRVRRLRAACDVTTAGVP